jgi:hypothetical protein
LPDSVSIAIASAAALITCCSPTSHATPHWSIRDQRSGKQFSLAPTVGQRILGPSFRDEAVAAGVSNPLLLGWTVDRDGDETRIDVERRVDDGEAVGRRAHPSEVAPLGVRVDEGERAFGVELGAEP